ncbi:MAG: hypothetical protein OEZ44_03885 [Candidatus Bathyarchaeota archaeon]|nr:hypothetical protein [Candidatus Bathyarchaeota archaeon]
MIREGRVFALLLFILAYCLIYVYVRMAKGGKVIKARALPPLMAIPEAVGRCAEMGRPLVYTVGIGGTISSGSGPDILAGITILGYTAREAAKRGVPLKFFTTTIDAAPLIEETLKSAYLAEGKSEEYKEDTIELIANQSSLVSRYLGWIQREMPASACMIGYLAYESVVLSEGGNTIGAMQISGTTNQYQTPFLVASTDYTFIMEELWAASAEISGDLYSVGALAGEDVLKFFILAIMGIGLLLGLFGASGFLINLLRL